MISTILLRKLYFSLKKFTKNVNSPQFVRQFMLPLWVLRIDDSTLFHTCFFYYLRTDDVVEVCFLTQLLDEMRAGLSKWPRKINTKFLYQSINHIYWFVREKSQVSYRCHILYLLSFWVTLWLLWVNFSHFSHKCLSVTSVN